jgi:hypothetical protein
VSSINPFHKDILSMLLDKALCLSLPPQNVLQAEISLAPAYIEEKDTKPFGDLSFRDEPKPVPTAGKLLLAQDEKGVSLELAIRSKAMCKLNG